MEDVKEQSWVIPALDDLHCLRALVLCRSLRRVFTSRKITALITRDVSNDFRLLLEDQFDVVFKIDSDDAASSTLPLELYSKLYCWQLTLFKKCVFIDCDSLVLENCDSIFDFQEFTGNSDESVFVCKPSFRTYNEIMKITKSEIGTDKNFVDLYFSDKTKSTLPTELGFSISESSTIEEFSSLIKIVRFTALKPWMTSSANTTVRRSGQKWRAQYYEIFSEVWRNIYFEDIIQNLPADLELPQGSIGTKVSICPQLNTSVQQIDKELNLNMNDAIAVIGLSCRFPGANSPDEFWDLLFEGKDAVRKVPLGRWDANDVEINEEDLRQTKAGFLKCAIDEFDAKFFGISPREAGYMDPQQRLLLEVAWEGLEDAGIDPTSLKGSDTGVFVGIWTADYESMLRKHTIGSQAHRVYLGNAYSATSARVSFFLGLNGPNIATESGCSSSFVSLHLACESLRNRDCNLALTGGVNLLLHPYSLIGSEKPYFMAADGHCKTFDAKADGFGRAEGCGMVVLKRFSDARRDGDRILGLIRGSSVNSEGTTASFGTPSKSCQELVVKKALKVANIDPATVSYVEAHGTGTIVGDPIEVSALAEAYSEGRKEALIIGSVKTNIGHAEGAAGVAGLIKVLLCMQHNLIPSHRNFESLNLDIPLDKIPAVIPLRPYEWIKRGNQRRLAGISSFGISGTNVHVIVEEAPECVNKTKLSATTEDRSQHILTLAAKSEIALHELVTKYKDYLDKNKEKSIADIAYTANAGRTHFHHRLALVAKDVDEAKTKFAKKMYETAKIPSPTPAITFLFTGQGSQYPGMAKSLYDSHPVFKNSMDKCDTILKNNMEVSILDIIWNENIEILTKMNGVKLDQTIYSQTSIFCIEYSLLQLWKSFGVNPDFVLGHSVGEFAAATAANILSLEDALKLVSERSQLIESLPPGGMLAIRASVETVNRLITKFNNSQSDIWIDIAVINSKEEVVVAGRPTALEIFSSFCTTEGVKTLRVAAKHAFHSRDMDNIMTRFEAVAGSVNYNAPTCGYISGRNGKLLEKEDLCAKYWQKHARDTVNFPLGLQTLMNSGCKTFIEVGPHPVLLALAISNLPAEIVQEATWLPTLRRNENEWTTLLTSLSKLYVNGVAIDWKKFDEPYARQKLALPTYCFQRQKYWFESTIEPNSLSCNTKILHPLLGRFVPAATNNIHVTIYQQSLLLENLPYLNDHQVANKIIMPGAGFMEMILAAGNLAIEGTHENMVDPKIPFIVSDFVIEAPLELVEEKHCRLQTVASRVSPENSNELKISIHRKCDFSESKWICHASAKFNNTDIIIPSELSKTHRLDEIRLKCNVNISTVEMYKKIAEVGIAFGPCFQSIQEFWTGENELLAKVLAPKLTSKKQEYICHPIILDAMLQAYAFQVDLDKVALYLPVAIGKFIWLSRQQTETVYLHISWEIINNQKQGNVKLLNEYGDILGVMEGVRLVKTSTASFLNFLNAQKKEIPGFYKEVFRPKTGTFMSRVDLSSLPSIDSVMGNLKHCFQTMRANSESYYKNHDYWVKLCYYYMINAFYKLGWNPVLGDTIESRELMTKLLISFRHEDFIETILNIFTKEGLLEAGVNCNTNLNEWKVVQSPPKQSEVKTWITDIIDAVLNHGAGSTVEIPIIRRCGENLAAVLQEKESALSVLFPENEPTQNASRIYSHTDYCRFTNEAIQKICETLFSSTGDKTKDKSSVVVRILEVGGGSGSTTEYVLEAFKAQNIHFNYTFTDISPVFLSKASEKFKHTKGIIYKILNIENDPKMQGFGPHQFDLVIASNVLHATSNIKESMHNIRHLLAPSGYFLNFEMFNPIRLIDFIYGVLEGYWKFTDLDLRCNHPLIDINKWNLIAKQTGFVSSVGIPTWKEDAGIIFARATSEKKGYEEKVQDKSIWLIFGDLNTVTRSIQSKFWRDGRNVAVITKGKSFKEINHDEFSVNPLSLQDFQAFFDVMKTNKFNVEGVVYLWGMGASAKDTEEVTAGLLHYSQCMLSTAARTLPKMFIVTSGLYHVGDEEPMNPTSGLLRGMALSLKSEQPGLKCFNVDLDPDESDDIISLAELYAELWTNDSEQQVALRDRKRFVKRLVPMDPFPTPMVIPNSERFKLILPISKDISDLTLGSVASLDIPQTHVEVSVKASGLNFRDIFVIMKPDSFKTLFDGVGMEFSGIVTAVGNEVKRFKAGDDVFGFTKTGAIATHCVVPETLVLHKPNFITHSQAATMPITFFTAYKSLIDVAKMKATDVVLLHVASGGVGLAALQICKNIGSEVIATAGSRRKRAYLRSLGIKHVFNSRNTNYGDEIMAVTNGVGVDIVLNSLTGPNFKETSLRVCKKNSRFVEMSKMNIWTVEEVNELRADVEYTIINLENSLDDGNLSSKVESLILDGVYKPLPYTRFDVTQTIEAFTYFQQAHHIGKIIITIPDIHYSKCILHVSDSPFNTNSTYLITGGLGGIGLEVAKFMANSGAKYIVLVGRSIPNSSAQETIKSLTSKGIQFLTFQVDIGDRKQCEELMKTLRSSDLNLPPLRGIMHVAGYISDGMIVNQTMEKYKSVFNAKVRGTWNLHILTKDYNLEHFVLFSSAAALIGPPGQSNHAAANSFLDTFAHYRYAMGLPVQTINWGIWSEIGVAAELALSKDGVKGIKPFSPTQGIAALKAILKYHCLQVFVTEVDLIQLKQDVFNAGSYLEELTSKSNTEISAELVAEGEKAWRDIKDAPSEKREGVIKAQIESMIRQTLKLPEDEPLDENQNFSDMGLDSLMAMEMRNKLQLIFGKNLTLNTTALLDNPNISALGFYLAQTINSFEVFDGEKQSSEIISITRSQNIESSVPANIDIRNLNHLELIEHDSNLPSDIIGTNNFVKPSKFQRILITGVTGQLGIYILPELCNNTNLEIYCLIRAKSDEDAKKRLTLKLKKQGLFKCTRLQNVICLTGSIVDPRLGLSSAKYDELAQKVDAIIHCAVKSNHVEEYKVQRSMKGHDLRSINVLGTLNILEFAAASKTKHVLHASSVVAVTKCTSEGLLSEELPSKDENCESITWGYAISKFVGEKLVNQALQRGIPCKVLRFPTISGHSQTGQFTLESNHMMLFTLACVHLGLSPNVGGAWAPIPVDTAAKISARLFLNDNAENGAYNINNPFVVTQSDIQNIAREMGHTVETVSELEWTEAITMKGEDSILFPLKDIYLKKDGLSTFISSTPLATIAFKDSSVGKIFSISEKLIKHVPEIAELIPHSTDICRKHLTYAEEVGYFKMFNIPSQNNV